MYPVDSGTTGSSRELTSSSADVVSGIAEQNTPTPESTTCLDTSLRCPVEGDAGDASMDAENVPNSNLETGDVDENERLESANNSSAGTDQVVTGDLEMEAIDGNNEGALCSNSGDQREGLSTSGIDAETSGNLDLPTRGSDKGPTPASVTRKKRQQPTLLTMFAANKAAQQLKQQKRSLEGSTTKTIQPVVTPLQTPGPSLTGLDEFLLENGDKLTVDVPVIPAKPLTPMEKFQQRLMKHVSASSQLVKREKKSIKTGEENGENCLVPENLIEKLKDKPGEILNQGVCMSFP